MRIKKSTKFTSVLMAVLLVLTTTPLTAGTVYADDDPAEVQDILTEESPDTTMDEVKEAETGECDDASGEEADEDEDSENASAGEADDIIAGEADDAAIEEGEEVIDGESEDEIAEEPDNDEIEEAAGESEKPAVTKPAAMGEGDPALGGDPSIVAEGTCGDSATWTFSDSGELVISGTGEIGYGGWNRDSVLSVTIGEGITGLGNSTFKYQGNTITISLPNTLESIDSAAFKECTSVESLTIPESVNTIGEQAFAFMESLKTIQLPSSINSWDTFWAFYNCYALECVTVPEGVTAINNMFNCNYALTSVALPSTLTTIGDFAFSSCRSLSEIEIPEGVTDIGKYAFLTNNLSGINLPTTLKRIGVRAFESCHALKRVVIPEGVEEIVPDGLICNLFNNNESLEYVYLPGSLGTIPDVFGARYTSQDDDFPMLREVVIGEGAVSLGDYAFYDLPYLESITLPSTLTDIGDYAFQNCTSLETIDIPSSVTTIRQNAFAGCTSLGAITLPENLDGILERAFQGCVNLTLPNGLPEKLNVIRGYAFDGCASLTSLTFPQNNIMLNEYAFANCTGLTDVVLPEKIYVYSTDSGIFMNCTSLAHVTLPDAVGDSKSNGESMFSGCSSLTSINIPLYIKAGNVVPAGYCKDCTSLVSARVAAGTETIKASAFSGCTSLKIITLPPELTAIEDGAFEKCNALSDVYFGGTEEQWNNIKDYFPAGIRVHYVDDYHPFLDIIITPYENGTVTADWQGSAAFDNNVKLTVTPDEGYQMKSLTVTDPRGEKIDTHWQRGIFRFYHRYEYVTVTAEFEPASGGGTESNPRQLTAEDFPTTLSSGWYEVTEDVTSYTTVMIKGDVHLILNGGTTLRARMGVNVSEGNSLTISGSGTLDASHGVGHSGIGSGHMENAGAITIDSGTVIAYISSGAGAAIGSGSSGNGGTVTINGGIVTAINRGGVGIGTSGGANGSTFMSGGTVTINGGTVTAAGGNNGAGIGTGSKVSGGAITINGGTVTATGKKNGAGIGGGLQSSGGTITINGGTIHAAGGDGLPAIGSGKDNEGTEGSIAIAEGMKVTVAGAEAPALVAGRVDACSTTEVTVEECGHDNEIILSLSGETSCAHCGVAGTFPGFGAGTESAPWLIGTSGRWNQFADALGNGLDTSGKYFRMTGDINVTSMMGNALYRFGGTFDGAGHTLTFTSEDHPETTAPFRYTSGADIRNLHVAGSIRGSNIRASGLIGENSGTSTVTNCRVSAAISGSKLIGGFCIGTGGTLNITGCVFDGQITGGPDQSGCFVAWGTDGLSIEDSISAPQSGSDFTGGTFCYDGGGAPALTNCLYMQTAGTAQGKMAHRVTAASGVNLGFGSGTSYDVSGITAYGQGLVYNNVFYAGKGDTAALTMPDPSAQGKKYVSSAGKLTGSGTAYTLVMPDSDVMISMEKLSDPAVEAFLEELKDLPGIMEELSDLRARLGANLITDEELAAINTRLAELTEQISGMRSTLDTLTDAQKTMLKESDITSLTAAEQELGAVMTLADSVRKTIDEINEMQAANQKAADKVINMINALPDPSTLDPSNEAAFKAAMDQIKAAEEAYKALTPQQKALVTNIGVLTKKAQEARKKEADYRKQQASVSIQDAKVVLTNTAFTYNGSVQKPAVKTIKGLTLKEGTDYTAAWSNTSSKNAGTYTVTIKGKGKYTGTARAAYTISKAANPMKLKGKTVKLKFSKLKKKAQTVKRAKAVTVSKAQGKVTYKLAGVTKKKFKKFFKVKAGNGKVTVKKGLKKGTYKVKVKVKAAGNANYNASAWKTVTFKVKVR